MKRILVAVSAAMLLMAGAAFAAETLNGAGATFPYPLYSKWFYTYEKQTGTKVNYASIGSGGGISQVKAGTVDFGCSDAPLTGEAQKEANLFMFPTVGGAVAIVYNVPGVGQGLKLDSRTVADIYLGKVTRWNNPEITRENPGVKLPDMPVIVAHRSDGSGTTNIMTWFLSDVSPEWKQKVGSGTAVKWPLGIGGKGNEGVAGVVRQTRGAIGYVEVAYAKQNKMEYAQLKNRDGVYVFPELKNAQAAAANAKVPDNYFVRFTYAQGKESYPIAGFTFMLVPKNLTAGKAQALKAYVKWAFENGDKDATALEYVPLPEKLKNRILADFAKEVK